MPADRSDLDHNEDWAPDDAGGPTAEPNLAAKHRGHHNLKTRGWWSTKQDLDGVIHWTTATGRRYTTYPFVYDDPAALPADQSTIERRVGARLAPSLNPSPLSARGRDFLVGIEWNEALADTTPRPRLAYRQATEFLPGRDATPIDPGPPPF